MKSNQSSNTLLPYAIVTLFAFMPVTLLTSNSLPSIVFYVLILVSLLLLKQQRFAGAWSQTKRYGWLIAGYSMLFVVVMCSSVYHGQWAGANSEGALRFFLGLWLLLLALPHVKADWLRQNMWGVFLAGVVSTAIVFWLTATVRVRPLTPGVILTTYTSIMLLIGAISLYSLKWRLTGWPRLECALKIFVAVATFSGFLVSYTRTGFLGLPVLILLGILLFYGMKKPWRALAVVCVSMIIVVLTAYANDGVRTRIAQGYQELSSCQGATSTEFNSMCVRVQLWRSAIDAGINHPWAGLGDGGRYPDYLENEALNKGLVSQRTVSEGFGEPHNDLLLMFAGFGYPGVLALLLIYLAPCVWFFPRLLSASSPDLRAAAAMGLAVCLGFMLFGLTETMFRRMNTMGFYAAWVALFLVLSESKPKDAS